MTHSKHTPGPWYNSDLRKGRMVFAKTDTRLVADCSDISVRTEGEEQANARLIAAAPELLEALEYLMKHDNSEGWSNARAAIAKARGQA